MTEVEIPINLVVIFLVYGLAFFSLGLATLLEAGRSPSLAEARILRPLAIFGLVHGLHEWLEMLLILGESLNLPIPNFMVYVRIGMLVVSFLSLIAYGVQVFQPPSERISKDMYIGGGMLLLYVVSLFAVGCTRR